MIKTINTYVKVFNLILNGRKTHCLWLCMERLSFEEGRHVPAYHITWKRLVLDENIKFLASVSDFYVKITPVFYLIVLHNTKSLNPYLKA